jgi:hypothetical protein
MQWKRINEMRTATWNDHTLHRAGAMNEWVKEMDKYISFIHSVICLTTGPMPLPYIYIYIYIYIYMLCKKLDGQGKKM